MKTRCSQPAGAPHVPRTETERGEADELRFTTALLLVFGLANVFSERVFAMWFSTFESPGNSSLLQIGRAHV